MHPRQQIDPAPHRIDGSLDFIGEIGVDQLLSCPLRQQLHERLDGSQVAYRCDFAQILARKLFLAQRTPAAGESGLSRQRRAAGE